MITLLLYIWKKKCFTRVYKTHFCFPLIPQLFRITFSSNKWAKVYYIVLRSVYVIFIWRHVVGRIADLLCTLWYKQQTFHNRRKTFYEAIWIYDHLRFTFWQSWQAFYKMTAVRAIYLRTDLSFFTTLSISRDLWYLQFNDLFLLS